MLHLTGDTQAMKTTSHKVVLPFYAYAALSFFIACLMLLFSGNAFFGHHFHPELLAITHMMALGWASMIILGVSHQLVPVLTEGELYSTKLAYTSFVLAAVGIPLLVYGFYTFNMGNPAKWGGRFVVLSFLAYLINLAVSISRSKGENVHAVFVFTAVVWLFLTAFLGLALVYNFTDNVMPRDSLHYLPLHAHSGIIGWFLLLVTGIGSRLIPMFLISKYINNTLLWCIYYLINGALIFYTFSFYFADPDNLVFIPLLAVLSAVVLFIYYCVQSYKQRIRKKVDLQLKVSLLSVIMILIPVIYLFIIMGSLIVSKEANLKLTVSYGFVIFFGWLTAIILGMTFKTLPFIVWNRTYQSGISSSNLPAPKDLFNQVTYRYMAVVYLLGFALFAAGIHTAKPLMLKSGAGLLILCSFLYNLNVFNLIFHKQRRA